jgi:hypothetical protein
MATLQFQKKFVTVNVRDKRTPKYISHTMVGRFVLLSLGNIPFKKIFLRVLFDTLTNNVSFLLKC